MAHQSGCFLADIAFVVHEQFIQEADAQELLLLIHIGVILFQNIQVGSCVLPVLLATGGFQNVAESTLVVQDMHEANVVIDGAVLVGFHDSLPAERAESFSERRFGRASGLSVRTPRLTM